jgi:PAS domain S-box-containing protein
LPQTSQDEVGQLIAGFNQLLTTLAKRDADLQDSRQHLQVVAQRLVEAQEIAHLGSWTLDLVTDTLLWSDEVYRIFEFDAQQFEPTYAAFVGTIHPDDRAAVDQAYTQSLLTRSSYQIEHRLQLPDGRIKWVQERCQSEFDASGRALRSVGTVQDL